MIKKPFCVDGRALFICRALHVIQWNTNNGKHYASRNGSSSLCPLASASGPAFALGLLGRSTPPQYLCSIIQSLFSFILNSKFIDSLVSSGQANLRWTPSLNQLQAHLRSNNSPSHIQIYSLILTAHYHLTSTSHVRLPF